MKAKEKHMSSTNGGVDVNEVVRLLALKEILIDHDWNARGKDWLDEVCTADQSIGGDENDRGLSGLIDSIKSERHNPVTKGQDEPVVVRPNSDKKTSGKHPYMLVAGFRRCEAIRRISEEEGDKNPTVRAFVRDMTDSQARSANLRENLARKNLSRGNVAWGFAKLTVECGMSPSAAAAELNMSQPYASQLHKIITKVKGQATVLVKNEEGETKKTRMPILEAWRRQVVHKTNEEMAKIADTDDPAKQEDLFMKEKKKQKVGPGAWVDNCASKAADMGYLLGILHHGKHVDASGIRFDQVIDLLVPNIKKDAKPGQVLKIVEAAKEGFKEGKKGPPAEKEELAQAS